MGTGPFKFVEHVKGSHWVGKKNPDYWDKGKPYLDGYRAIFISASAAQVAAIRGERAHIQFRGFSPPERDSLVQALGNKITVQESPWDCIILVAHEPREEAVRRQARPPGADARPRPLRGLARRCRKIALVKDVARHPGAGHAVRHAARGAREARRLRPRHRRQSRAEAKRLLQGGGRARGLLVHLQEPRHPACPTSRSAIWLIDQWRQIGLNVKQEVIEAAAYSRRCCKRATSRSPWTSSAASSSSPTWTCTSSSQRRQPGQLRPLQGHGARRALQEAGAGHRPRGAQEARARSSRSACSTRRRTTSIPCSGTASSRTAPRSRAGRSRRATT